MKILRCLRIHLVYDKHKQKIHLGTRAQYVCGMEVVGVDTPNKSLLITIHTSSMYLT